MNGAILCWVKQFLFGEVCSILLSGVIVLYNTVYTTVTKPFNEVGIMAAIYNSCGQVIDFKNIQKFAKLTN